MKGNKLFRRTRWNFNLKSHWQLGSQRAWKFVPYLKYAPGLPALIICLHKNLVLFPYLLSRTCILCLRLLVSYPCVITAYVRKLSSFIYSTNIFWMPTMGQTLHCMCKLVLGQFFCYLVHLFSGKTTRLPCLPLYNSFL